MNLCARGHDKDVVGTVSQGRCAKCRAISRGSGYSLRTLKLPSAPLLAVRPRHVRASGPGKDNHDNYAAMGGVNAVLNDSQQRALYRARQTGYISVGMADEISCAFGYHPAELYGEVWWSET